MATNRRKVLCLGVSFPCIGSIIAKDDSESTNDEPFTVDNAIELVRCDLLTQMDGRDLARCMATEKACNVDVYTVSQEKGALYRRDRHLYANFNRRSFAKSLLNTFNCAFDEVVLDYFWIPKGWDESHWKKSFFGGSLVDLVTNGVLKKNTGIVYLPFCLHSFQEVIACKELLLTHYNIKFLSKEELHKISLWKGTQTIERMTMQCVLGKRLDQEEVYCTFNPLDASKSMDHATVSKDVIMDLAANMKEFANIRFIALEVLDDTVRSPRGQFFLQDDKEVNSKFNLPAYRTQPAIVSPLKKRANKRSKITGKKISTNHPSKVRMEPACTLGCEECPPSRQNRRSTRLQPKSLTF